MSSGVLRLVNAGVLRLVAAGDVLVGRLVAGVGLGVARLVAGSGVGWLVVAGMRRGRRDCMVAGRVMVEVL